MFNNNKARAMNETVSLVLVREKEKAGGWELRKGELM